MTVHVVPMVLFQSRRRFVVHVLGKEVLRIGIAPKVFLQIDAQVELGTHVGIHSSQYNLYKVKWKKLDIKFKM